MTDNLEELKYPIGRYERPGHYTAELKQEWMNVLEALPKWMDVCIENLDEVQLKTPYRPGGWTVIQVVHHVADSHMNAYVRLKLALTEHDPIIKPYKEALWAQLPDANELPVNISITLLHAMHRRWVHALRCMTPEDWERPYFHPDMERNVPIWEMTAMYAWHSRHHMEHIRQLRERMSW
ncbi:MAG: putative metal-dependent hydrolase [Taibaiella sp.]|nr:putative metal-dependent hydrolase [Taibaiella sp.]